MSKELVDGTDKKSKYKVYTLIALAISISVLLLFIFNFNDAFMGNRPTFSTAVEAIVFLVAWLIYGAIVGYNRKKSFIKFVSFYWGLTGLISLTALLMEPIGKWAIIVIPVWLVNLVPTYGLEYFLHVGTHKILFAILCATLPWLSGTIGFLLGYLLKKIRVSMIIR